MDYAEQSNIWDLHKNYIQIDKSKSKISPVLFKSLYGKFNSIFLSSKFVCSFKEFQNRQVFKFNISEGYCFVLKRTVCKYKVLNNILDINPLSASITEFQILKMIWAHPLGVKPIDFKITHLVEQDLLVSEILMTDAGDLLFKSNANIRNDHFKIIKLMQQTTSIFAFMEAHKIVYNDIKSDNFIIDKEGNIKLIDFDSSGIVGGYTDGFVSPEKMNKNHLINPWLSDVYSWGIFVFYLVGIFVDIQQISKLDIYKKSIENHKTITDLIDKIYISDNFLSQKIQLILKSCLSFQPEKRLSFRKINIILNMIDQLNIEETEHLILSHFFKSEGSNLHFMTKEIEESNRILNAFNIEENVLLSERILELAKKLRRSDLTDENNDMKIGELKEELNRIQFYTSEILLKINEIFEESGINITIKDLDAVPDEIRKLIFISKNSQLASPELKFSKTISFNQNNLLKYFPSHERISITKSLKEEIKNILIESNTWDLRNYELDRNCLSAITQIMKLEGSVEELAINKYNWKENKNQGKNLDIENKFAELLSEGLICCKHLRKLLICYGLSNEGAVKIAESMIGKPELTKIEIGGRLDDKAIINVCKYLQKKKTITNLYLLGCFGDQGAFAISNVISDEISLKSLYIMGDQISDEGTIHLFSKLSDNTSLKKLHISGGYRDLGAQAIAKCLSNKINIQYLSIYGSFISDNGVEYIANNLLDKKDLIYLYINGGNISNKGANLIAESICYNMNLTRLCLRGAGINKNVIDEIRKHLNLKNKSLKIN